MFRTIAATSSARRFTSRTRQYENFFRYPVKIYQTSRVSVESNDPEAIKLMKESVNDINESNRTRDAYAEKKANRPSLSDGMAVAFSVVLLAGMFVGIAWRETTSETVE